MDGVTVRNEVQERLDAVPRMRRDETNAPEPIIQTRRGLGAPDAQDPEQARARPVAEFAAGINGVETDEHSDYIVDELR